jgi:hypothetical protein
MILLLATPRSAKGQGEGEEHVPSAPAEEKPPAPAVAPDTQTVLLRQELAEQKAALAALRADVDKKLAEEQVKRNAAAAQAKDEAVVESKKSSPWLAGLSLSGFAQTDFTVRQSSSDQLNSSTGDPLNQNRFMLRRARLATTLDRGYTAGVFELDANSVNGAQVRPIHFEATVRLPPEPGKPSLLALTAGLFKIPFGYEVLQSDTERLFMERSAVIQEFFPGEYDFGARLAGGWRFARYALAVQNGEPVGEKTFPQRDPNSAKDISGRLGIDAPLAENAFVAAGFSALTGKGFHKGLAPTKSGVTWNDRNENNSVDSGELIAVPAKAAIPSQNFSRNALGVDTRFTVLTDMLGASMLYGEVVWAKNLGRGSRFFADPVAMGRDVQGFGYNLALVQDIYNHVQVGIRYDHYDPDRDTTDLQGAKTVLSSLAYDTWAFAGAVRTAGARLVAEFDLNRNHNGRDNAGMPTNLADNAFTLRAEVSF